MSDAIDKPDEGDANLEDDGVAPVPSPAQTTQVPDWALRLTKGASAGDNGNTLQPDPGDEGFGELTEAQRYEEADLPSDDGPDELWDD